MVGIALVVLSQLSSPAGLVVESQMHDIADKVASDAVDQYRSRQSPEVQYIDAFRPEWCLLHFFRQK